MKLPSTPYERVVHAYKNRVEKLLEHIQDKDGPEYTILIRELSIMANLQAGFSILDASISDLLSALSSRQLTSVDLVARYIRRISVYDANGLSLSSVPILNPHVFQEATSSDSRRARGLPPRPLEGIPFLAKDNVKVKGMTAAAGSHAFEHLIATEDAACVTLLRAAGAIVLGRTNMPGMANGGMQRGLYGRAESPYNTNYLTAAYASGSSNGSGTATTSCFAAFALGTETVSSGRSPASNNALVAYTPSRGLLPLRGVWPLYPICDVLVPYTRTMADMLKVLDVLVSSDAHPAGDFWASQPCVPLPSPVSIRRTSFESLGNAQSLQGKRLAVPSMYIGGHSHVPIRVRPAVLKLWGQARKSLEACGAEVIVVDNFPLVSVYETPGSGDQTWANIAGLPNDWLRMERCELIAHAWEDFLAANGQPGLDTLTGVNPDDIFPIEPGTLQGETEEDNQLDWRDVVNYPQSKDKPESMFDLPGMHQGLSALEAARKTTLEEWMDKLKIDAVVFPANGDVGPSNADVDEEGSRLAWENGVLYSNGNLPMRHLGVPTVSIPMGIMDDIQMPVNLTFAGRAYDDVHLLEYGQAFESATRLRVKPELVPALDSDSVGSRASVMKTDEAAACPRITVTKRSKDVKDSTVYIDIQGELEAGSENSELEGVTCYVNGEEQWPSMEGQSWKIQLSYPESKRDQPWVRWRSPALVQTIVIIVGRYNNGTTAGELVLL